MSNKAKFGELHSYFDDYTTRRHSEINRQTDICMVDDSYPQKWTISFKIGPEKWAIIFGRSARVSLYFILIFLLLIYDTFIRFQSAR